MYFYSRGHSLSFQMIWFSLSCINSPAPILALDVYYLVPGTNSVSWEVTGLTQAGVKLSNQCQQLKNKSSNSSARGSGMGDWKDGDKCAGTFEETKAPDGQVTSDLTHCWQHLSLNGRPPWGHHSVCSSVEAEII